MLNYSAESIKEIQNTSHRHFSIATEGHSFRRKTGRVQIDKYIIINAELCEQRSSIHKMDATLF